MEINETTESELFQFFNTQKSSFSFSNIPSLAQRASKLKRLAASIRKHETDIVDALNQDFGNRSEIETRSAEIGGVISHIHYTLKNLQKWAKPRKMLNLTGAVPGKTYIRREPKGVVGIISPWNYPLQLGFIPMITALAAGNRVMVKPSEATPATNAVMVEITKAVYDEAEVAWVLGEADIAAAFSRLPFDHLFYTGSTQVGRLVAMEAAKNLTPVSLELGGKSPVLMLDDADMDDHSRRVAMGKFYNGGQTCVAPDYMLVPKGTAATYGKKIIEYAQSFYTDGEADESYTAIISDRSFVRLTDMVETAKKEGCQIIEANLTSNKQNIRLKQPTVVLNPSEDSAVMSEEIFGPVLPIIEYNTVDEAVEYITKRDHPLALYIFSNDVKKAVSIMERTTSGGALINGTLLHTALEHLPFGGVGKSGYGAYHGERGYAEFSHERSVLILPKWKFLTDIITPPYGKALRGKINSAINSA